MRTRARWIGSLSLLGLGCSDPGGGGYFPRPDTSAEDVAIITDTSASTDTALPDIEADTSPLADTRPDTSGATCTEGMLCDDRDPCTRNDRCTAGVCRGETLPCDDGLACTEDTCVDGVCKHPQAAKTCLIGGACYNEGDARPDNACLRCDTTVSPIGWSTPSVPCDDGDPCTLGEACNAGTCGGGTRSPACSSGPIECSYHTECYPERVCGLWVKDAKSYCSNPCAGDSDCGPGQICTKVPGSVQVGYCQDTPPGGGYGAACTEDYQCANGICADGICAPLCLDETHCIAPNMTCHPVGDLARGLLTTTCTIDAGGTLGLGAMCTADQQSFDPMYCASGHCDLMALTNPSAVCAPICKSESDCPGALECNIVLYGDRDRADSIAYDPQFTAKTRDALSACFTPEVPGGTLGDGAVCTQKAQCRSNKCLPLIPGNNQPYCTSFCATDAQCPANMACKLDVVNMVSDWLVAAGNATHSAYSLVRICKFR